MIWKKKKRLTQPADPVTSFLSAKYMASGGKITTLAIQNRQLIRLMIQEKKKRQCRCLAGSLTPKEGHWWLSLPAISHEACLFHADAATAKGMRLRWEWWQRWLCLRSRRWEDRGACLILAGLWRGGKGVIVKIPCQTGYQEVYDGVRNG